MAGSLIVMVSMALLARWRERRHASKPVPTAADADEGAAEDEVAEYNLEAAIALARQRHAERFERMAMHTLEVVHEEPCHAEGQGQGESG